MCVQYKTQETNVYEMKSVPTTPYTFRMDKNLRKALEQEAEYEDRPAAQLANRAIKAMIQAKAAKREALETALVEADKGEFVSQEGLNKWMDSWDTENEGPIPEPDIFSTP